MRRGLLAVTSLCTVLIYTAPLLAHHAFAAEYDNTKFIKLTGKVTKVDWTNPHVHVHIDAKDANGQTVNYAVEGGGPNALLREGWRRDTLKPGDTITVDGYLAKDGSNTLNARTWVLPDGKKIFASGKEDGKP